MARRASSKKADGILFLLVVVAAAFVAVVQAILKFWIPIIGIIVAILLFWCLKKLFSNGKSRPIGNSHTLSGSPAEGPSSRRKGPVSSANPLAKATPSPHKSAKSTTTKPLTGPQRWVPAGETLKIRGFYIDGGMVYVGNDSVQPDASLIDPSLVVRADGPASAWGYWPTYSGATPENRAAYLKWLEDGKDAPDADIGCVFLYFYGLERRVLADADSDPAVVSELPLIESEIIRLQSIYVVNHSFQSYSDSLIGYIQAIQTAGQCIPETAPAFAKSWEFPFALKLALARFVAQDDPIPGDWAYAWWHADPATRLKTAAERCPDEFRQLFIEYYGQKFKPGLRLRPNKTRLSAVHRVASPSLPLRHYERILDLPDVTMLTAPMKKLQEIADCCHQALDRYSRHLGRKPQNAGKIDALLELPTLLWPEAMKEPLLKIHGMVSQSGLSLAVQFDRLLAMLPPWETVNKASYSAFARSLAQIGLGIEPDPQFSGGVPGGGQTVVLFVGTPSDLMSEPSQSYRTAALSLQFAVAVSHADGEFGGREGEALTRQLEEWLHLGDGERTRLQASLRWMATEPPGLNGLKRRTEEMPVPAREALGEFLILVAKADERVSPQEVKVLERIFKMLGLDVQPIYGKLHAPVSEPVTVRQAAGPGTGHAIPRPQNDDRPGAFRLDMDRVSGLQEDTQRVSELLHAIFDGQEQPEAREPDRIMEGDRAGSAATPTGFLGLVGEYCDFARLLITRSQWTRAELEELAADRSLLLDGALEHINEAAYDRFDQALVEDGDPLEINQELIGELIT